MTAADVVRALKKLADAEKAAFFPYFFKTGKGQYGEGDVFIGVTMPQIRSVVKQYRDLPLSEVELLLESKLHECRLAGVLLLVDQYQRGDAKQKKAVVRLYLKRTDRINNWDLVDASAYRILGPWAEETDDRQLLDRLAASKSLWEQRMAMVAMYHFIRKGDLAPAFRMAERLLHHTHDLMHKAVGWMLREAGKRDPKALDAFLLKHHKTMPRTALRYAIEKLTDTRKKAFMKGTDR